MKRVILFALIQILMIGAHAQEREYKTLMDLENIRLSGMGGPFTQLTMVGGDLAHMVGGGGAILVGDFWLGGYGLEMTNQVYVDMAGAFPEVYNVDDHLNVNHGGFWIGYSLFGDFPVHVAISSLIGWGQISVVNDRHVSGPLDGVFVVSPTLEVELNLTNFFRLGVGASYNLYTFVDNIPGYSASDFSNPGAFLSIKFGWF